MHLEEAVRAGATAVSLALEIARASPLAVKSMRHALRRGFADAVEVAMERELLEQTWQRQTADAQRTDLQKAPPR